MAPEEIKSAGMCRLHLMEAIFHIEFAMEHIQNLANDEDIYNIGHNIRSAQSHIETIHTDLCEETDALVFNDWSGQEALFERMREALGHWSAYQFSEWKQTGKVNHG
jgi:hypothetical protein